MTEINTLRVNPLPGPTWNWLRVNDTEIKVDEEAYEALAETMIPGSISDSAMLSEEDVELLSAAGSGMGAEFAEWIASCPVDPVTLTATKGMQAEQPAVIRLFGTGFSANRYRLVARKDSFMTVVMYLCAEEGAENVSAALETRLLLEEGARVSLVQICDGGAAAESYFDVAAELAADSELSILHITKGEAKAFFGVNAELRGESSRLVIETAYTAEEGKRVDINYAARHAGKKTESRIEVSGVLRKGAEKVFRGTIDFQRGCAGAKGDETENVLLLDDDVVNKTVPLILCQEEDVEGNHGATIGDLSDETLYYFRSRGISDEEAYRLLADGRMIAALRKIPDRTLRTELLSRYGEGEEE